MLLATVPQQQSSTATACSVSPMELPLGGPALRHYTQSRPRPHRQKLNYRPSRPQETIIESENEVLEHMGRVDEGVEEFFTKRVLPTDTLKKQDEETIIVHEVAPASSAPCPPPTKTLRRKLGDFFTLKKRRGLKSEPSQEGRPKKASIADFIRPLRDKEKDKDRVKEHEKENEKEKGKEHPSGVTGDTAVQETPVPGAPPLRGEAVPPRRALREGKSQSLILLSGSAAAGTTNARNTAKKQIEGQHSFEQKLHLMLQRIGVSKAQPGESQNQEGEMKKAESEGTIIDSKPEPPSSFTKPRTMSASSDTRHQLRPSVSAHESAGKPALLPKPVLKPGPPTTTSGRNTPETELAQIQEGDAPTPTKLSPSAAPSAAAAPTLTSPTTPAILTISDSVPDSTSSTISPSSTVPPPDRDLCTDSATAAATVSTSAPELENEPSIPEANATTTELATASFQTTRKSMAAPTEPPTTPSTSSESITPSLSVTSISTTTTTTTPSVSTSETVSGPSSESQISTTSASTKATLPEPIGNVAFNAAAPAAATGDAITVTTTTSLPSTSVSDMPTTTSSVHEASDDSISVTSAGSETLVSSVTETSLPPNPCDTITSNAPVTSSSCVVSPALPPTSSISSTTATTSPTCADCVDSIPSSNNEIQSSADISAPPTSSSETNPTDTTTTTTTSLNHEVTTPTTSSATTAAFGPPVPTEPPAPTPTLSATPTTDNSSSTPHHLTSPAPSNDSPDPAKDSPDPAKDSPDPAKDSPDPANDSSPEEGSSVEPAGMADGEIIQQSKQTETDESKKVIDGGKESDNEKGAPALVNGNGIRKEEQEESVKPEEDAVKTEAGVDEPAPGKDEDLHINEGAIEGQKQEETKSGDEK